MYRYIWSFVIFLLWYKRLGCIGNLRTFYVYIHYRVLFNYVASCIFRRWAMCREYLRVSMDSFTVLKKIRKDLLYRNYIEVWPHKDRHSNYWVWAFRLAGNITETSTVISTCVNVNLVCSAADNEKSCVMTDIQSKGRSRRVNRKKSRKVVVKKKKISDCWLKCRGFWNEDEV